MSRLLKKLMQPKILGQFRHLLSAVGPLLAANGLVGEVIWQAIVGLIMAAIAFTWSWFSPEKKS